MLGNTTTYQPRLKHIRLRAYQFEGGFLSTFSKSPASEMCGIQHINPKISKGPGACCGLGTYPLLPLTPASLYHNRVYLDTYLSLIDKYIA